MKYFNLILQNAPEIDFLTLDLKSLLEVLSANILIATVLLLGIILLAALFYYSICVLVLFWEQIIGYKSIPGDFHVLINEQAENLLR